MKLILKICEIQKIDITPKIKSDKSPSKSVKSTNKICEII